MEKVQVLMSTYNGAEYLEEQILSIMNQKNIVVTLAIRDDGSSDGTKKILKYYENENNIDVYYGENIGYAKSFLWLLDKYKNKSEYFSFSDQDDYWLPEKLNCAVDALASFDKKNCNLYFSNLIATDTDLSPIEEKNFKDRSLTLGSSLSRSNIAGCTMVFNKKLAQKVSSLEKNENINIGHDSWVQYVCLALNGNVYYDEASYIFFRRHGNTTTTLNKKLTGKVKYELRQINNNSNVSSNSAQVLYDQFNDQISETNKRLLFNVANYKNNFGAWFKLLINDGIRTGNIMLDTYTILKIIFLKY